MYTELYTQTQIQTRHVGYRMLAKLIIANHRLKCQRKSNFCIIRDIKNVTVELSKRIHRPALRVAKAEKLIFQTTYGDTECGEVQGDLANAR